MRTAAIITGPQTHLDHLGVLSTLLNIPLIVTEEHHVNAAKQYYPDLSPQLKSLEELSLPFLAQNYDVLFQTGKFFATELKMPLQWFFRKQMRFVFCPHGNSDKGRHHKEHPEQDISLVYGDHLEDLLKQNGAIHSTKHLIRTGNYRYVYYLKHKPFFDALVENTIFSYFKTEKPVILYAPTWQNLAYSTSFFKEVDRFIEELSPFYNVLIKLHPFLAEDFHTLPILERYANHPSVQLLTDFPLIYPLLNRSDIYIGDYSSVGYDFLTFDKPLYFFNPSKEESLLETAGLTIPDGRSLKEFLDSTLTKEQCALSHQRKKLYEYTFETHRSIEGLKMELSCLLTSNF